ncbi:hypothetical protein GCM10010289_81350 [Streptomyces violascens]|uniref:Helicase-associated domain-containing protein n=1 Tax=Streptomyces violascens TaxID=67381 RepID=A0ABQ3QRJ4_9ACTN|nr:hypothetical protein GCM10010289_81350 [Streptomyces violascens]GHI39889.1 hypothetical protein Sviol_42970 [Streptomyces violascens]
MRQTHFSRRRLTTPASTAVPLIRHCCRGPYPSAGHRTNRLFPLSPPADQTDTVVVKLGVWITNTKSRRDKLTPEQRAQLAELGLEWAR